MNKHLIKLFISILLLFAFSGNIVHAEGGSEQEKLKDINEEIKQKKQVLEETKQKERESLNNLVIISKELKETEKELNKAQNRFTNNRSKINQLSYELQSAQKDLRTKSSVLSQRVVEIYKGNHVDLLELLFMSKSMADFINRTNYFSKVIEKDVRMINSIIRDYNQAQQKKRTLEDVNKEIKQLTFQIKEKKDDIETKAEERKKLYESLKTRRQEYERQLSELERSSNELQTLIQEKIRERGRVSPVGSGKLIWPAYGRITSWFGYRRSPFWGGRNWHTGIDIANSYGKQVQAADSGEVIFSGWWDGYGKAIVIDHGKGIQTVYGHLSRIYSQNGVNVAKGQVIGLIGNTGYSTGPHLHFEVRKNGKPVNPVPYLPKL